MKMLMLLSMLAQGGQQVSLPESLLTAQQKAYLVSTYAGQQLSQFGEYVGLGREIGVAVNDALIAITDRANEFAQTDVGRLTVALVVYKVIGRDILHMGVGLLILFIMSTFCYFLYRVKVKPKSILQKVEFLETGKKKTEHYEAVRNDYSDDWMVATTVIFVISVIISLVIFFT